MNTMPGNSTNTGVSSRDVFSDAASDFANHKSVNLSLLQFIEAAQSLRSDGSFARLVVQFVRRDENNEARHEFAGSSYASVTMLPNALLRLECGEGSDSHANDWQPSKSFWLRVVVDPSSESSAGPLFSGLSSAQVRYLPLVIATCRDHLISDSRRIEIAGSDLVPSAAIARLRADSDNSSETDRRIIDLNTGPFRVSAAGSIVIGEARALLKKACCSHTHRTHNRNHNGSLNQLTMHQTQETPDMQNASTLNQRGSGGFLSSPPPISAADRRELRKHVINLDAGRFSTDGKFTTSEQDVAAIFQQHIPDWIDTLDDGAPARVVFYAHGGLTDEAWGLFISAFQMRWWKENDVYPVFFVWETGLIETLRRIFSGSQRNMPFATSGARGALSDFFDELEDKAWEIAARAAQGPTIWLGMKESARLTFAEEGDGLKVLDATKKLATKFKDRLELHCVGHSAGSIILSYLVVAAKDKKLPNFESMHFLAPAITCELFRNTMMSLVGSDASDQVNNLSLFTMSDDFELDDTVGPYDKSLLYLIHHALEPEKKTPILGLDISLVSEPDIARFFGLAGSRNNSRTDVVFSQTAPAANPRSRSLSITHGGFDNDRATMQSVLRRIIKAKDTEPVSAFPESRNLAAASVMQPLDSTNAAGGSMPGDNDPKKTRPSFPGRPANQAPSLGNRRALCIGINEYPRQPLGGCVNDSNNWRRWLESRQFIVDQLLDSQATRQAILGSIERLFANSRQGDVLAIQFAGHGTQVTDLNGDESQGDTPGKDEALVPVDFLQSGLVLDDDLGELCRKIPSGVSVTFFMDCCHSGTNTRLFMSAAAEGPGQRARFLQPTAEMIQAHERSRGITNLGMRSFYNPYLGTREIVFAACQSSEVAMESGGSGDFTRHAMAVLARNQDFNAEQFLFEVKKQFGVSARQTPGLWCDVNLRTTPLAGGVPA